jgi:heme-degrading monooxygenase HmoA
VISVWDSEDAFRKFEREQLMPTFQRLGRSAPTFQVSPLESVSISPTAATQAAR